MSEQHPCCNDYMFTCYCPTVFVLNVSPTTLLRVGLLAVTPRIVSQERTHLHSYTYNDIQYCLPCSCTLHVVYNIRNAYTHHVIDEVPFLCNLRGCTYAYRLNIIIIREWCMVHCTVYIMCNMSYNVCYIRYAVGKNVGR